MPNLSPRQLRSLKRYYVAAHDFACDYAATLYPHRYGQHYQASIDTGFRVYYRQHKRPA